MSVKLWSWRVCGVAEATVIMQGKVCASSGALQTAQIFGTHG